MASGSYRDLLNSRGFQCFLWTQFLGALNDNVFKILVSMLAVDAAGGARYLSLSGAVFILPFLLFSGYAGQLADIFNKRTVLIVTKAFEIVAMVLGLVALLSGRIEILLAVLFLMALQATFFSPAKYGVVPEMLLDKDLSRANGLLEMSTFVAIILGTSAGSFMLGAWKGRPAAVGLVLIMIAVAGTLISLGISRVPGPPIRQRLSPNPWGEIFTGLRRLYRDKPLWLTVFGISYFWFLGALFQMDIILFGKAAMGLDELRIGILVTFLAVGIGIGSIVAGKLSGDKVELGLPPLGAIGMGIFSLVLARSGSSYTAAAGVLALLGFSAGLFIVPLNALLQQKSGVGEKGRLIATNNFVNTIGILLASGVLWVCRDLLQLSPESILFVAGLLTLAGTAYTLVILPDFLIRFVLWMLTHSIYRIRIAGQENVPVRGPALLVSNHISLVDSLLVGACLQRFVRFLMYRPYYQTKGLTWLFRLMKAIPIEGGDPQRVAESIGRARQELQDGHVVCIFAEGSVSRTGNLLKFKRGFERIVNGLDVPVIPVHLDRLWGSIFSFNQGQFFWRWPQKIPYPVTVSFGRPMPSSSTAHVVRQAVQELGSEAVQYRRTPRDLLHLRFIETAKRRWFAPCMADSTGKKLTYGRILVNSMLLAGWVRRHCKKDSMVSVMLPPSVDGALANIAVLLAGKVPVAAPCGTVLDHSAEFSTARKLWTYAVAFALPTRLLQALWNRAGKTPDSLATVIFTKNGNGVMLSHHNIISNIEAIAQVYWVTRSDCLLGVLPFSEAAGFTITLWLPILAGFRVVYHPDPMDVGEAVAKSKASILIATPAHYAAYVETCTPEQFASLRWALVGGERVPEGLAQEFQSKYGLPLVEGYGANEMAPVIAVNIPDVQHRKERQTGSKPGTVGHPIPGVSVKVVDPSTREPLPPNHEGLLLVKGPNRMLGYLGDPERTSEVFHDGWYITGDMASIDDDGFLRLP